MERTRGSWASKLLVVCLCMTVALMGLGNLSVSDAEAKGVKWYRYCGNDVRIWQGGNYIAPNAMPKVVGTNATMTARQWVESFVDLNGVNQPNGIRAIEFQKVDGSFWSFDNILKTYSPGVWTICETIYNYGYWVHSFIHGYLPMHAFPDMNPLSTGWAYTPTQWIFDLPTGCVDFPVGMYNQYRPAWPPPVPPPPPDGPWHIHISYVRHYLHTGGGNDYTGRLIVTVLNETTKVYMTYDSANPTNDFVWYGNTWGTVGPHRAVLITLPAGQSCWWWTGHP